MPYVLNLIYLLLLAVTAPYWLWVRATKGKYREGFAEKFWGSVPVRTTQGECVWMHAVSVGEVNLLAPLIERMEQHHPGCEIVISTTTQAGFMLAQKKYAPRQVFYAPLDFSWSVRRAISRMRPTVLMLAELELWPNWILAAQSAGVKVAIVNGRLSEKSFRGYQRIRRLVKSLLQRLDLVAVQNQAYADRFLALGAAEEKVTVTGCVKFDHAKTDRSNPATKQLQALANFSADDVVFLAGSTQPGEEEMALEIFAGLAPKYPKLRLVLVPRHPERFEEVAQLLSKRALPFARRSRLLQDGAAENARILLVDVVGELGAWWGTSQIAFVGGSMGNRGGQNMIEPAAYGAAVSFGPNTWNFRDIVSLLKGRDAAVVVKDEVELQAFVERCLQEPAYAQELGKRAQALVLEQLGAADRTIELLGELLPSKRRYLRRFAA